MTDENLDPEVVAHLRIEGFDVWDVMENGADSTPDDDLLRKVVPEGRVVVTHDSDFGTLAIRAGQPVIGIVYLRPGHIDSQFTIETIDAVLRSDPILQPPFILVAKRKDDQVKIRIRRL